MSELVVHDTELKERVLTSRVSVSNNLRKYFKSFNLFIEYDEAIHAEKSVLNIPPVAMVLPLAWLAGADVRVDEIDKMFKQSMGELKRVFKSMYPRAPFTTEIIADQLVENKIGTLNPSERTGLLFSGGVDSTYSLLTNLELKPRLIMFWGTDDYPYPENKAQWEKIIPTYSEYADRFGLQFNVVKTNISQVLFDKRVEHDFHQYLYDGTFRMRILHTFVLLPLAAPLSISRFDRLIISAGGRTVSLEEEREQGHPPSPSRPETDEKIIWADLTVKYYGGIGRKPKIDGVIKEYLEKNDLKLKVCLRRLNRPKLNDSTCIKCLNNIAYLVLAGVDPNTCGFEVDQSTWKRFRHYLENELEQDTAVTYQFWSEFRDKLPEKIEHDIYGSKEFFNWFKNFDLKSKEKNVWLHRDIYHKLPYPVANMLDKFYQVMGIKIRDQSPLLRQPDAETVTQA